MTSLRSWSLVFFLLLTAACNDFESDGSSTSYSRTRKSTQSAKTESPSKGVATQPANPSPAETSDVTAEVPERGPPDAPATGTPAPTGQGGANQGNPLPAPQGSAGADVGGACDELNTCCGNVDTESKVGSACRLVDLGNDSLCAKALGLLQASGACAGGAG